MGNSTITAVNGEGKFRKLFEKYLVNQNSDINDFILSIPPTLEDSLNLLRKKSTPLVENHILYNRKNLKTTVYSFHKNSETLNDEVQENLKKLELSNSKIIVAIHQPNLFAFSGVFKKIILLEVIANRLNKSGELAIPLFLVIDHDFMDDKWMHTAKLPNIRSTSGILDLRYPISESKRWKMSYKSDPPTKSVLNMWENQIYKWIRTEKNLQREEKKQILQNFEECWDLVLKAYTTSKSYSEFNSHFISKITNKIWKYGTLFVNLSELSSVFKNGYDFLLSNAQTYTDALEKSESYFKEHRISTGVSTKSNKNSPLWIHCGCGSKGSSKIKTSDESMLLEGRCISCKKLISLKIGTAVNNISIPQDSLDKISPRAIPILLLLSRELGITGYISGIGGSLGYTIVGKRIFDSLRIDLPSMIVWPAEDKYDGFAQKEAQAYLSNHNYTNLDSLLSTLEQQNDGFNKKIKPLINKRRQIYRNSDHLTKLLEDLFYLKQEQRKLKEIHKNVRKVQNALNLKPCIIDYAANFGISNIAVKWSENLIKNNDLTKSLNLN